MNKFFIIHLTFIESLKVFLNHLMAILVMSAKLTTQDVFLFMKTPTNFLSQGSNCIVDEQRLVTLPSYEKSYHNFGFIKILPEKSIFLKGGLDSSLII